MLAHFLPQRSPRCQDGGTCSMVRRWSEVRSWTDYILGTYPCLFKNVVVQDPRYNSDHYLVLEYLRSAPLREHTRYLGRRKRLPLRPRMDYSRPYGGSFQSLNITRPG